ncbi:hypothetical protein KCA24_12015, partial [Escherichia coli]|nr:hypothetical protein [Escherichia coli]
MGFLAEIIHSILRDFLNVHGMKKGLLILSSPQFFLVSSVLKCFKQRRTSLTFPCNLSPFSHPYPTVI